MVYPLSQLTIGILIRLFIKKVYGKQNVIKVKPFIIACNHSSYLDDFVLPTVIYSIINKKTHFYVNSSYFRNIFSKMVLDWYESIPVEATKSENSKQVNQHAFEISVKYLEKNEVIIIFPEGTRSIDGKIQKGKTGVARLALTTKVPVLPIGIIGSNKILPKGKFLPRLKRCEINIGDPLYFKENYNKKIDKKSLEKVTRIVMKNIAVLIGQKYNY